MSCLIISEKGSGRMAGASVLHTLGELRCKRFSSGIDCRHFFYFDCKFSNFHPSRKTFNPLFLFFNLRCFIIPIHFLTNKF